MPTYHYHCPPCLTHFEQRQSILEDALTECPQCHQHTLSRVLYPPTVFDATPKTLGAQADRNMATLGRYKLDSLQKQQDDWKKGYRGSLEGPCEGATLDTTAHDRPSYLPAGQEGPSLHLLNLTPEQQGKYIETGKVP